VEYARPFRFHLGRNVFVARNAAAGRFARMGQRVLSILFTHFGDHWIRGSERILLNLAAHLDRTRFTPVVWCNGGPLAGLMREAGVTVHESDFASFFGYNAPPFDLSRYLSFVRNGLELARRHDIGLIHCNGCFRSASGRQFPSWRMFMPTI
jgi:hypothetical protein